MHAFFSISCSFVVQFVGTFKLKKMDYKKDGFNPLVVKDKLFYLDPKTGEYEGLDMKAYTDIVTGQMRIWCERVFVMNHLGIFYGDAWRCGIGICGSNCVFILCMSMDVVSTLWSWSCDQKLPFWFFVFGLCLTFWSLPAVRQFVADFVLHPVLVLNLNLTG